VLLTSQFRGFSQFGFLAGMGTLIIGFTLFSWSPAVLAFIGDRRPEWVPKAIGVMKPPPTTASGDEIRIPHPRILLSGMVAIVAAICAFAIPWTGEEWPKDRAPTVMERLRSGVVFNYNTRALVPEDMASIKLQDEINRRFKISSDPIAYTAKTIEETKAIWDELTNDPATFACAGEACTCGGVGPNKGTLCCNPANAACTANRCDTQCKKYPSIDQVVSVYSFVPPPDVAAQNAKVLEEWDAELKDIDVASLPPEMQEKAELFKRILAKRPYGVNEVPEVYAANFRHLPTTKPENHGFMTFVYPSVDLWDGKKMMNFAAETRVIKLGDGREYRAAGLAILYATLAKIVLFDGKVTVILATIWILLMHFLDFRNVKLALASVIPLGVGLWMMLGLMSLTVHTLNFMNLVILPILLGFGVSHGLYLLHRFLEGTSRAEVGRRGGREQHAHRHRRLRRALLRPAQRAQVDRLRRLPRPHHHPHRQLHRARRGAAAHPRQAGEGRRPHHPRRAPAARGAEPSREVAVTWAWRPATGRTTATGSRARDTRRR
jgi:hypothetical protein